MTTRMEKYHAKIEPVDKQTINEETMIFETGTDTLTQTNVKKPKRISRFLTIGIIVDIILLIIILGYAFMK